MLLTITTPNIEYNVKFENLPAGKLRHKDHRFWWSRTAFQTWGKRVAASFDYSVEFFPVGSEDVEVSAPRQMGVFSRD